MKTILILSFLTVLGIANAQTKTISLQNGVISMTVHDKWKIKHADLKTTIVLNPKRDNLFISRNSNEGRTLSEHFKFYTTDIIPEVLNKFKVQESGEMEVNGQAYMWLIFDNEDRGITFRVWYLLTEFEGQFYDFMLTGTKASFNDSYQKIKPAIQSIKFQLPQIVSGNSDLSKMFDTKWKLVSSIIDGFPDTNAKERGHYFQVNPNSKIEFHFRSGELMFSSTYSYDNETNVINYMRESRIEKIKIVSIDEELLKITIVDYMKSNGKRTYKKSTL